MLGDLFYLCVEYERDVRSLANFLVVNCLIGHSTELDTSMQDFA